MKKVFLFNSNGRILYLSYPYAALNQYMIISIEKIYYLSNSVIYGLSRFK